MAYSIQVKARGSEAAPAILKSMEIRDLDTSPPAPPELPSMNDDVDGFDGDDPEDGTQPRTTEQLYKQVASKRQGHHRQEVFDDEEDAAGIA